MRSLLNARRSNGIASFIHVLIAIILIAMLSSCGNTRIVKSNVCLVCNNYQILPADQYRYSPKSSTYMNSDVEYTDSLRADKLPIDNK